MDPVKEGDLVHVHYTGRLDDGTVFDSSDDGDPLEFVAGSDALIGGMAKTVVGMKAGDKRTITLEPADAYGDYRPELAAKVPRTQLPEDVAVGDELTAKTGENEFRVRVTEMGAEDATVDANHPLAGKTLTFELEIACVHPADN